MALSVYKESTRGNHPSSIWMVQEMPGLMVMKQCGSWKVHSTEWIPDHKNGGENLQPHPQSQIVGEALAKQAFTTRQEALQAIETAQELICA